MIEFASFWTKSDRKKISIALSAPNNVKIDGMERRLNPTWAILNKYKQDRDWDAYIVEYNKILAKLDPHEIGARLEGSVACCWCRTNECHRYLVAAWLKEAGFEVVIRND